MHFTMENAFCIDIYICNFNQKLRGNLINRIKLIVLFIKEWKRKLFSAVVRTNTSTTIDLK